MGIECVHPDAGGGGELDVSSEFALLVPSDGLRERLWQRLDLLSHCRLDLFAAMVIPGVQEKKNRVGALDEGANGAYLHISQ